MKRFFILAIVLGLILLNPGVFALNFNENVNVSLKEWPSGGGLKLFLKIETQKQFECKRWLSAETSVHGNKINVNLKKILNPTNNCLRERPAVYSTKLPQLEKGEYVLNINSGLGADVYNVLIEKNRIVLKQKNVSFSKAIPEIFNRFVQEEELTEDIPEEPGSMVEVEAESDLPAEPESQPEPELVPLPEPVLTKTLKIESPPENQNSGEDETGPEIKDFYSDNPQPDVYELEVTANDTLTGNSDIAFCVAELIGTQKVFDETIEDAIIKSGLMNPVDGLYDSPVERASKKFEIGFEPNIENTVEKVQIRCYDIRLNETIFEQEPICDGGTFENEQCVLYECIRDSQCGSGEYCSFHTNKCVQKTTSCVPVINTGSSEERADIVFLGDGYENYGELEQDIMEMITFNGNKRGLFSMYPFSGNNKMKFNIWMVQPEQELARQGCVQIQGCKKILGIKFCDYKPVCKIGDIDLKSAPNVTTGTKQAFSQCPAVDYKVTLSKNGKGDYRSFCPYQNQSFKVKANDGSKGYITLSELGCFLGLDAVQESQWGKLLTHEFGHQFGKLKDEYMDERNTAADGPNCVENIEQARKAWGHMVENETKTITKTSEGIILSEEEFGGNEKSLVKRVERGKLEGMNFYNIFNGKDVLTAIDKPGEQKERRLEYSWDGEVGYYAGCEGKLHNIRPTKNSVMNDFFTGYDHGFGPVNEEVLLKELDKYTGAIEMLPPVPIEVPEQIFQPLTITNQKNSISPWETPQKENEPKSTAWDNPFARKAPEKKSKGLFWWGHTFLD